MTERIRALLEEAVADVQPREVDPVPALIRHARSRQRQGRGLAIGAGLGILALLGAGIVAVTPASTDRVVDVAAPSSRSGLPVTEPAVPVVEDGQVRAGGTTLPVPAGWHFVQQDRMRCVIGPRGVVTFAGARGVRDGPCRVDLPVIEVIGYSEQNLVPDQRAGVYGQIILPGGQPGWVPAAQLAGLNDGPSTEHQSVELFLPWSGAKVSLLMSRGELRQILATIRTEPITPIRLVLPTSARAARLSVGQFETRTLNHPDQLRRLRELLAGLTEVVPANAACGTDQPMTRLELVDGQNMVKETISISGTPDCAQATSSLGGRVRTTGNFLPELTELFVEAQKTR